MRPHTYMRACTHLWHGTCTCTQSRTCIYGMHLYTTRRGTRLCECVRNHMCKGMCACARMEARIDAVIEMLTGNAPFSHFDNHFQVMYHVGSKSKSPPIPDNLSASVKEFLSACFRPEPGNRPSARALMSQPFITSKPDSAYHTPGTDPMMKASRLMKPSPDSTPPGGRSRPHSAVLSPSSQRRPQRDAHSHPPSAHQSQRDTQSPSGTPLISRSTSSRATLREDDILLQSLSQSFRTPPSDESPELRHFESGIRLDVCQHLPVSAPTKMEPTSVSEATSATPATSGKPSARRKPDSMQALRFNLEKTEALRKEELRTAVKNKPGKWDIFISHCQSGTTTHDQVLFIH